MGLCSYANKSRRRCALFVCLAVTLSVGFVMIRRASDEERRPSQATKNDDDDVVTILLWTEYFGDGYRRAADFGYGTEPFVEAQCSWANCRLTSDRSLLETSRAVVFHANDYNDEDVPAARLASQRYVFFNYEALSTDNRADTDRRLFDRIPANTFNWTMTHRRNSDIHVVHPYGALRRIDRWPSTNFLPAKTSSRPADPADFLRPKTASNNNKTKLIAWFVSHCHTSGRRETYFAQLGRYVPIDTYGACGNLSCAPWNGDDCFETLLADYKFYISAENALCPDYVTEKFYRPLAFGSVPIVYGGADYASYAPSSAYIHVGDFGSVRQLADYLLLLDNNDALYAKHFDWKSEWRVVLEPAQGFCDLCQMLNDDTLPAKSYANLSQWWYDQSPPCYPGDRFIGDRLLDGND